MVGAVRFEDSPQTTQDPTSEGVRKQPELEGAQTSAQPSRLKERATKEEIAAFVKGFAKISEKQKQTLLKLAFDHPRAPFHRPRRGRLGRAA